MANVNPHMGARLCLEPEVQTQIPTQPPAVGLWPSVRISLRFTFLLCMMGRVYPPLWGGNDGVEARTLGHKGFGTR